MTDIIRKGVNRFLVTNTNLQKLNDENIQKFLNKYQYHDEKK